MQTTTAKPASVFSSIRISLMQNATDSLKAMASCVVGGAIMVTGLRIVEGKHGIFVSMPQRKNAKTGDYSDVAFPVSREMREELQRLVLDEFQRLAHSDEAPDAVAAA